MTGLAFVRNYFLLLNDAEDISGLCSAWRES